MNPFPQIAIARRPNSISFQTTIRIKHTDEKWYLVNISVQVPLEETLKGEQREQFILQKMSHFYTEVYTCLHLMKVDTEAEFGPEWKREKVFVLDKDQRNEPERLQAEMDAFVEKSKPKEDDAKNTGESTDSEEAL